MIATGERVQCIDKKSLYYGQEGTFIGWLANGLIVEFDSGKEGLFLACDLKKINTIEEVNISL